MSMVMQETSGNQATFLIGPQHGIDLPGALSVMPEKLALYSADTYFLESWEDLVAVEPSAADLLQDIATITFKPDAFAARAVRPALDWLSRAGFQVVGAEPVFFDRATIRGIWLYQWNVASRDRKDVVDDLLGTGRSLVVFLRRPRESGPVGTASNHLSTVKGPAVPAGRVPGQLRSDLASPNTLLNFVHTADEPADLVRELGVYFPAKVRQAVYRRILAGADGMVEAVDLARQIESEIPAHHLDFGRTLDDVRARVADGGDNSALLALLQEVRTGRDSDWRVLLAEFARAGVDLQTWDRLVLTTTLVNMDNPAGEVLIRGISSGLGAREHS